jgi:hypothetical protein
MTARRFRALLAVRGPALDRWPAPDRRAALALLARSAGARRDLAAALADDAALQESIDPAALARMQTGLHNRIAAQPRNAPRFPLSRLQASARARVPPAGSPSYGRALGWGAVVAGFALGAWLGTVDVPAPAPADPLFISAQAAPLTPDL